MDRPVLNQVKKFITEMEDIRIGQRNISIQFFGGEPLVEWETLKVFVTEMKDLCRALYDKEPRFGMTTNGTLLNDERLQFLKKHNINLLLSLDGRKNVHDVHRKNKDGEGSFDKIPLALIMSYFPNVQIRPTITPETIDGWSNELEWFYSIGLTNVATEVNYEGEWTDEKLEIARKEFEKIAKLYLKKRKAGQKIWLKFVEDARMNVNVKEQKGVVCGTANNSIAIDAAGNIYACQRWATAGSRDFAIGNVFDGFNEEKLRQAQSLVRENMKPEVSDCSECLARYHCRGGCNAVNHWLCGQREIIPEIYCKFQRIWTEIAVKVLLITGELCSK